MTGEGWLLIGGYFLCGLIVASIVYHLHFWRQAPQDGGVVLWMIPIWPVVVACYVLFGIAVVAATVITFGRCWRSS